MKKIILVFLLIGSTLNIEAQPTEWNIPRLDTKAPVQKIDTVDILDDGVLINNKYTIKFGDTQKQVEGLLGTDYFWDGNSNSDFTVYKYLGIRIVYVLNTDIVTGIIVDIAPYYKYENKSTITVRYKDLEFYVTSSAKNNKLKRNKAADEIKHRSDLKTGMNGNNMYIIIGENRLYLSSIYYVQQK